MSRLFTEAHIGDLKLRNRIVRSATAERLADHHGLPFPALTTLLVDLARGGAGLLIMGHLYVSPEGRAHPGMTAIDSDQSVAPLRCIVDAVHREGGCIAAQLNHAGMKATPENMDPALAPSDIGSPLAPRWVEGCSDSEIHRIVAAFGRAADRAVKAGFDAIQIHSAHGYLGSQFLSPLVNRRRDRWGGTPAARMTFLQEVTREVRRTVGPGFPVFVKLGMLDDIDGGLEILESLSVVERLADFGLDAVEISGGISQGRSLSIRTVRDVSEEAYFREAARSARQRTDLPILLVGGLRSRSVMDDVLDTGDADFVSLCRPLICEPDLPRRFEQGLQLRSSCISGNRCWPEQENDVGISCKCLSRPSPRSS